jgi:hypothetical protein
VVRQGLADGSRVEDEGEHSHRRSTLPARQWIDFVDSADELCPELAQTPTLAVGGLGLGAGGQRASCRRLQLDPCGGTLRSCDIRVPPIVENLFVSAPHFQDYRERASSFESLAALYTYHEVGADLLVGDRAQRIVVLPVSAEYFRLLRRAPLLGREFTREEETGEPLAVVSEGLWRRAGLDREGLGATIELDGEEHTVVGVMPVGFEDPLAGPVDLWVP